MKRLFFILCILLATFSHTFASNTANDKPDFRFPKTVAREAESDLKRALRQGDGEGVVDALVRYSLAWSSISTENLDDITTRIEQVANGEQRPDIRALLLHLEARVLSAHPDRWRKDGMAFRVDSLLDASLRDIEALTQCPLTNYPRIIDLGENPDSREAREGQRLLPTLTHFLLYHARQMGKDMPVLSQRYLQLLTAKEEADNAERQRVHDERQFVHANFNSIFGSRDSIRVKLEYRNVHQVRFELLRVPDDMHDRNSVERKKLKSVYQADITLNDTVPNKDLTQTVALPPHGYGRYVLMCSYENRAGERILPESFNRNDIITITDVEEVGVMLSSREEGAKEQLQTITLHLDRHSGRPAEPDALDKYYQHRSYHPGNDTFQDTVYQLRALTDRGLYRPGETVKYTALLSGHTIDQHHPLQGRMVVAALLNTERKELKKDTLWTDTFGQAESSFELPVGERTGNYAIQLQAYNGRNQKSRLVWGNETFAVSEYKAPTFSIDLSDTPPRVSAADSTFTIRGRVTTFTGLPLKHTDVKVGILESWWSWWRHNGPDADEEFDYEATATTDADGRFVLHVPMSEFYDDADDKEDNMYLRAVATCTNAGGETQSERCNLMLEGLDDDEDDADEQPAKPFPWTVTEPTQLVDSMIPAGKAMWIHEMFHQQKADKEALVRIGTSVPDAYIYYIASDKQHGVLRHGWLHYAEPGLHDFTFAMPQPAPLGQQPYDVELQLSFLALRHGELTTFDSHFTPQTDSEAIRLSLVTFRDRLLPGGTESWTFRVQGQRLNLTEQRSRLMLTLYDHSLDDLEPFAWSYQNQSAYQRGCCFSYAYHGANWNWGNTYVEPLRLLMPEWPELNLYGARFFDVRNHSRGPVKVRGTADLGQIMLMEDADALDEVVVVGYGVQAKSMATGAVANRLNGVVPGVATQEEAGEVPAIDPAAAAQSLAGVKMREGQQRLALWEPMLTTDSTGTVSLTFEVPDQNTTWRLQALALAPWLTSARLDTTLLAQRPLMVQPSLPRFVRQGDRLSLSGLVLNATSQAQQVVAMVEVFNPRTRQQISSEALQFQLDAKGQRAVEVMLQVPDTLEQLAYSIRALVDGGEAAGSGDGEQRMLPVLPAVSPVIETIPFYLNPGDSARVIELPESLPTGADIQLEWCDNPVVYCLEALPSLMSECHPTSSSLIHRLFAYALSEQVVHRYPQSMADSLLTDLSKLQNADGGFSWIDYRDRYSSLSATAEVLELLGELHQLGAYTLPEPMTTRALAYYDKAMLEHYQSLDKKERKQLNINFYCHYLYLRSLFPEHSMESDAKSLFTRAMSQSMERWGELELAGRAYVALALHRQSGKQLSDKSSGKQQSASRHIVESLRQHALTHPHRGMYWDQLGYAGYRWLGRVTQTSLLLQAFAAIDPHTDELDQIRKWLLLEKQTSHWGNSSLAADAVYALLSSGSDWQSRTHIEGLRYDSVHDRLLLRDTLSLLRTLPSDTRRVEIPAASATHPSWGAVYMRYAAPTRTAQAASNEEILITKQLLTADGQVLPLSATAPDGQPLSAAAESLHVGDRVTIRLTVKTTRDMSEVMITDERAACLEPVTQLPGYHWHQGVGYYLEPLDQRTHLFIPRLPRGEHLFTYDLYVTSPGHFALGLASVQCQYAPMFNAHTAGRTITVE